MDFAVPDYIIFCCSIVLMALLLMELLDWSCIQMSFDCPPRAPALGFLYGDNCGPSYWRCAYPEARGVSQSPINIVGKYASVLAPSEPLSWHGYNDEPVTMSLSNDGNTVVLHAHWTNSCRPWLEGGPLRAAYDFHSAAFRWGPANDEGSEHTLDYVRHALELQVLHMRRGLNSPSDAANCRAREGILFVSYLFQVTEPDNPYLDHIVTNLRRITNPGSCIQIPPFPLEWLMPYFKNRYYSYTGSLSQPPCSEIAVWIVQPTTVAISANQIAQFRKICSTEGPILSNCRPVQKLNDREVIYYS